MQTIVLATQKGGSGKSTLAIGLALAAIRAGHNVRLIETDPQGTVSNWKRRRPYAAPIIEPIYAAREVEQRLQSLAHSPSANMHRAASPRRKCAPSGSGPNRGWAMRLRLLTNRSSSSSWKYPQLFLDGLRSRLSTPTAHSS